MNPIINVSINVSKVDKSKLYEGKQGKYLNLTLIPSKSEYGDYMVVQSVSKEDRAAGIKGAILGNGKLVEPKASRPVRPEPTPENQSDEIPF